MMNLNSAKQSIWFIVLVMVVAGLIIFPAISRAVTVGPVKLEYTVDPGKTLNGQLFLQNDGSVTQTFYPSFEKFTESNGQKNFTKEESDLSAWFKVTASVVLKPGESRQIPFKIVVPKNAPPGGHFAVIWWSTSPLGGNNQQVSIVTRAGILVYLTVSGDVKESGTIVDFSSSQRIYYGFPLDLNYRFQNTGNSYLKPAGQIIIKNIFGAARIVWPVNQYGSNVLPQSDKSFNEQINSELTLFGVYRAELDLVYGTNQEKVSRSFWFLILPWKTIVLVLVLLFLLFFVVPRGLKRYNAWIIKKARG